MRTPPFEGEVRLGVPYDIIGSFVPAILRGFAKAQPRARQSGVRGFQDRARGVEASVASISLTTETECGRHGETLRTDRLVWVGATGGDAHLKDPLPVSLGADLRLPSVAIEALGKARRDWRAVCGEPARAGLCVPEAGLAVAPLLRSGARTLRNPWARGSPAGAPEFRINLRPPGLSPRARASPTTCAGICGAPARDNN